VRSAHSGRQQDPDFRGFPTETPEVAVPHPNSIAARAEALRPFVCSSSHGSLGSDWVHVAGALDIATTPQLEKTLRDSHARLVVLDMRDLGFMDCAGVHTIVNASVSARRDGRRLVLVRGIPHVDNVFALTGNSQEVEIGDIDPLASLDSLEPYSAPLLRIAEEALVP
jgi:anti-anti-sigma factor